MATITKAAAKTQANPAKVAATKSAIISKEAAKKIARQHKIKKVYENSGGEFFTSENLAHLSEGGNVDKVITHDFTGGFEDVTEKEADVNELPE